MHHCWRWLNNINILLRIHDFLFTQTFQIISKKKSKKNGYQPQKVLMLRSLGLAMGGEMFMTPNPAEFSTFQQSFHTHVCMCVWVGMERCEGKSDRERERGNTMTIFWINHKPSAVSQKLCEQLFADETQTEETEKATYTCIAHSFTHTHTWQVEFKFND